MTIVNQSITRIILCIIQKLVPRPEKLAIDIGNMML